jgi:hypothetical protein
MKNNQKPLIELVHQFFANCQDDSHSKMCLAIGIPIFYIDFDTPKGFLIKEYPNGQVELVDAHAND